MAIMGLSLDFLSLAYAPRLSAAAPQGSAGASSQSSSSDLMRLPPWDVRRPQEADSAKLKDALANSQFITRDGAYFERADIPEDHKKLFSLYTALARLQTLAEHATDKKTPAGTLNALDDRFQSGLDEITGYLSDTAFDGLVMLRGQKKPSVEAALLSPRGLSQFTGGVAHRGAFDAPLTSITGNESFTISVRKAAGTTNVLIDLSAMGATPRTIDNVVSFINTELAANGIVSRFKREKIDEGQWGFHIQGVSTEELSFSASASTPALYLAGTSGDGEAAAGQMLKLTGTANVDPTLAFSRRIEAEGGSAKARAVTTDSDGHVYVVGTTDGSLDANVLRGESDVYLTKYDSTGNVLWQRMLGASDKAEGFALATDTSGDVVVAGRTSGDLTPTSIGGGGDSFVTKFNGEGEEVFTRQIAPVKEDGANALAVGADGAIYLAGYAKSAIGSGASYAGGEDAYVTKLDATGALVWNRQFGTSGNERATSLAIADDGDLIVGAVEAGHGVVRKFSADDGVSGALWSVDLGALQGGTLGAIAVDGSAVYAVGSSGNAALNAGGAAAIVSFHHGGRDGFLTRIDDAGGSATAQYTTYIGTSSSDGLSSVVAKGGAVYVAGETHGTLPGETKSGTINGFAAKLDGTGAVDWFYQYGGRGGVASSQGIAIDPSGSSVLDALGLPRGTIDYTPSRKLTALSTLREGDSFQISVNGKPARRIRIAANETLRSLMLKINGVLLLSGKASIRKTADGEKLKIDVHEKSAIELIAGEDGRDALQALGLPPGKIVNDGIADTDTEDQAPQSTVIGLGLDGASSLKTSEKAAAALKAIENALAQTRKAYRALTLDPLLKKLGQQKKPTGPAPAYLRDQIANYAAGLQRLNAGTDASVLI